MSFKEIKPWEYNRSSEIGLTKADLKRQRRLTSRREVENSLAEEEEIMNTLDDDEWEV